MIAHGLMRMQAKHVEHIGRLLTVAPEISNSESETCLSDVHVCESQLRILLHKVPWTGM